MLWVFHGFSILHHWYAGDKGGGDDQQGQGGEGEKHRKNIWTTNKIFVDATTEESAPLLDPVKRRIDQPRRVNHLLIRQTVPSLLLHLPSSSLYVPEPQDTRTIWINFQGK